MTRHHFYQVILTHCLELPKEYYYHKINCTKKLGSPGTEFFAAFIELNHIWTDGKIIVICLDYQQKFITSILSNEPELKLSNEIKYSLRFFEHR